MELVVSNVGPVGSILLKIHPNFYLTLVAKGSKQIAHASWLPEEAAELQVSIMFEYWNNLYFSMGYRLLSEKKECTISECKWIFFRQHRNKWVKYSSSTLLIKWWCLDVIVITRLLPIFRRLYLIVNNQKITDSLQCTHSLAHSDYWGIRPGWTLIY